MKKTLIALAALASTAAFAQSAVNLTGVVGFAYQKNTTGVDGFTNTDATIAVAVREDLGGGLTANAAIAFDAASSQFGNPLNRRNTSIGLTGGFGSVSLINTRSSDLLTRAMVAPSNLPDNMYGTSGVLARVPVDVLSYGMAFGGVQPYIQYVEWNADGDADPLYKTTVLGVNYSAGPLAAGLAYKATSGLPAGAVKNNVEGFATYNFGVATVGFGFDTKTNPGSSITVADAAKTAIALGVSAPLGPVTAGLNYAKRGDAKVTEVAVKYDLSKRTHINASFGKQSVDAESQYRIGIYHAF